MYNGRTSKLAVQKNVICDLCNGKGGKSVSGIYMYVHVYALLLYIHVYYCTIIHVYNAYMYIYIIIYYADTQLCLGVVYVGSSEALWSM